MKLGKYDDDANLQVLRVEFMRDFTIGKFGEPGNKQNYVLKLLLVRLYYA